jgi:prevent-host-death family protein
MTTVTALEAKTRLGNLLSRVAKGEEIVITRHDKPIARLVPEAQKSRAQAKRAAKELLQLRDRIAARLKGKGKLTYGEYRSALEEGRR